MEAPPNLIVMDVAVDPSPRLELHRRRDNGAARMAEFPRASAQSALERFVTMIFGHVLPSGWRRAGAGCDWRKGKAFKTINRTGSALLDAEEHTAKPPLDASTGARVPFASARVSGGRNLDG